MSWPNGACFDQRQLKGIRHMTARPIDPASIISNPLVRDPSGVFILQGHDRFDYSEGERVESFLDRIYRGCSDLGSSSRELDAKADVWPTEYYLSIKRAQLLSGFVYDRSLKVLEVGCGCGTITRFLGENFDSVVAVEGSLARARLARLRNRDLSSVSVVCGPFQEMNFSTRFDIIFCIGVFEYSAGFVEGPDPYDAALKYFSDLLTPDGKVVIAIENQLGLKYFNGASEDHIGVAFEGVEGYHRRPRNVRTFGKTELGDMLGRYFPEIAYYYPFPDYKFPDAVLSSKFLASGRAGEMIAQLGNRHYGPKSPPKWDETAATLELARNRLLEDTSSSFLFVASRGKMTGVSFPQLGVFYSHSRREIFSTQSRIVESPEGEIRIVKKQRPGTLAGDAGRLHRVDLDTPWLDALSLQTEMVLKALDQNATLEQIFARARPWAALLKAHAFDRGGILFVDGTHIDAVWQNAYMSGENIAFIDREFVWQGEVRMNALVVRSIYGFITRLKEDGRYSGALAERSGRSLIEKIAAVLGIDLTPADFDAFVDLECEFDSLMFDSDRNKQTAFLRWYLFDRPSLGVFRKIKATVLSLVKRARFRFGLS
jgi:SAM-dependent methyltransferase